MSTERLVKWSKEGKEFFEKTKDKSIVLDLVISYGCASQTGEGFEELVNTINSEEIKRKVKKVNITDTSYLYRHIIPQFSGYCDTNIPTEWFLINKNAIENIKVEMELKSWANGINSEAFKKWYRQIKQDFFMDSKFKDEVLKMANNALFKSGSVDGDIGGNIDFILEETAYTCLNFKNVNMVYPMSIVGPVQMAIEEYKLNVRHLAYDISDYANRHKRLILDRVKVNNEIIIFITEKVTNVNFFVIDKQGNFIYRNESTRKIVKESNAKELDNKVWENSTKVMKENKQITFEETDKGKTFLSVKSPLLINGKVEGVIGLAVDITGRKKKEEVENKLKMEKELYEIAREVVHDTCSPLSALETVRYMSLDKLGEKERKIFELSTRRIKDITSKLIERYREKGGVRSKQEKEEWIMPSSVKDIIKSMRYRYQDRKIRFEFKEDKREKFAFIRGEYSTFSRMITNVIKNGVEAIEGEGEIEVREIVKGEEVEIRVKDNGQGMPKEMAEKIMRGEEVKTTKEDGHGIEMGQIMGTIKAMRGKIKIDTKEGEGTEFILTFPKAERPRWFADKIEIKKGGEVVILDDELVMHEVWKEKLKGYEKEIIVKYFTKGLEALKYLNSLEKKEKEFLIADYELKEELNGIDIIEKSGMKERHILVTNAYLADIKDFEEKSEYLKIFLKMYIGDISLKVV